MASKVIELSDSEDEEPQQSLPPAKRARGGTSAGAGPSATGNNPIAIDIEAAPEIMQRQILSSLGREAQARRERKAIEENSAAGSSNSDATHLPGERKMLDLHSGMQTVKRWRVVGSERHVSPAAQAHATRILTAFDAQPHPGLTIEWAEYIVNPFLVRRFESLQRRLGASHHVVYLFHGTGLSTLPKIEQQGFLGSKAMSGGTLIWFSRQAQYSYGFTARPDPAAMARGEMINHAGPSGRMFLTALLVAHQPSETSNVGDHHGASIVITMQSEAACLPMYVVQTRMAAGSGWQPTGPAAEFFPGEGHRLGGWDS